MKAEGARVVSGNAVLAAKNTRGWFLGHFMPGPDNPLRSDDVELKWFTHPAGDTRPEWAPGNPVRTLNLLIRGSLEESLVLTVRWPSIRVA
ncbi:MAG: hypothetical protein WEF50_05590 [Myxococcota bacterium]